ncbi:MAG: hypothetical protein NTV84_11370, partial [Methanoregula sp.]|nr:hypothetical protein [Methanoregula sp.]
MVLEESLLFNSEKDANEFKGCTATKKFELKTKEEVVVEGPIDDLIDVFEEIVGEERESEPEDDLDILRTILKYTVEDSDEEVLRSEILQLKNLKSGRDLVAGIMEKHNVGDIILSKESFDGMQKELTEGVQSGNEKKMASMILKQMPLISHLALLWENDLIKTDPAGLILAKKVGMNEIITERRVLDPEQFSELLTDDSNLTLTKNYDYILNTRVIIDQSIFFPYAPDDFDEMIVDLDCDRMSLYSFMNNVFYKEIVSGEILKILKAAG